MSDAPLVKTKSFYELRNTQFPPDNFLVSDGLLPRDGLLFIAGPPKSYKSFVMLTMIYHLLTGSHLFGAHRRPHGRTERALEVAEPCRVLLFEQEIGFYDVLQRVHPLWQQLPPHEQKLMDEHLFIHSRDHTMRLDDKDGWKRMGELIQAHKPEVVCFDPLIEFHHADENDAKEMAGVMHNLDVLRNTLGFATLLSHHTGKPSASNVRTGPDNLRGSSVIFGKGDSFLMLTPTDRDNGILRVDFTIRRSKPIPSLLLTLNWSTMLATFLRWDSKSKLPEGVDNSQPVQ